MSARNPAISQKYSRAVIKTCLGNESLVENWAEILSLAGEIFHEKADFFESPFVKNAQKNEIFDEICTQILKNSQNPGKKRAFLMTVYKNQRLRFLRDISDELREYVAKKSKNFPAIIISKDPLDPERVAKIAKILGSRLNARFEISEQRKETDEIEIKIPYLWLSAKFSEQNFYAELKNHILKAF